MTISPAQHPAGAADGANAAAPPGLIEVALVVVVKRNPDEFRILLTRRPDDAHCGGLWEFPGGKIEPGESPAQSARRELLEETRIDVHRLTSLMTLEHTYPDRPVRLHVFTGEVAPDVAFERVATAAHLWVASTELHSMPMPEANEPIVAAIRSHLGG